MLMVPSNRSAGRATGLLFFPLESYAAALIVFSAIRLALLLHEYDAVRRTGDRTADVDQVALGVDLLDAEVSLRVAVIAVVTGHLLALDHTRRIGAWSDRSRTAVLGVSMRVRSAVKAVALHDALEPAALRCASDLDLVAGGEDF